MTLHLSRFRGFTRGAARRGRQQAGAAKGAKRDRSHAQDARGEHGEDPPFLRRPLPGLKPRIPDGTQRKRNEKVYGWSVRRQFTEGGHSLDLKGTVVPADRGRWIMLVLRRTLCTAPADGLLHFLDKLRRVSDIPTAVSEFGLKACELLALGVKLGLEREGLA